MDDESTYQALLNQGYTEEQIQLIMQLGLLNVDMEELAKEQLLAEELRRTPDAQGRHVGQGRVFVQANPLEHLGVAANRLYGDYESEQLREQRRDVGNEQMRRRIEWLRGGGSQYPGTPGINPDQPWPSWAKGVQP